MPRSIVLAFLLVCVFSAIGQGKKFDELKTKNVWSEGSILLSDGAELKGLVRYDDRQVIVNYQSGDVSRSFTPRNVTAFEFFDEDQAKQRVYYTLEYEDSKVNVKRPLFFEMLKDFGSFGVLSKLDPIDVETKQPGYNPYTTMTPGGAPEPGYWTGLKTEISQVETIYFMNEKGVIEPYLKVTRTIVDRKLYDREKQKNRIVGKKIVDKYFTPAENEAMEKFADEQDLDFRVKEDLLKILDFYAELRKGKK